MNEAPRVRSASSTRRPQRRAHRASATRGAAQGRRRDSGPSLSRAAQASACSRAGTGRSASRRPSASRHAPVGESRAPADVAGQAQRVEHRRLIAVDAVRQDRAAPTASAASSKPSSASRTARSPSMPVRRLAGSTCCHANRNRMKSDGLTGSISARAGAGCSVQRMDPREQAAVTPFQKGSPLWRSGRAAPGPHPRARAAPRSARPRRRCPSTSASACCRGRSGDRQAAAQESDGSRPSRLHDPRGARRRRIDRRRCAHRVGVNGAQFRQALGRHTNSECRMWNG